MKTKIIKIYKTQDEINKLTNKIKNYTFSDFNKHQHFEFSLVEKATDLDFLSKIFPKFEDIKSVELRENEKSEKHYSFNYELQDGTFVIISLALDKIPPLIVNGFHAKRNYKEFEKSLKKNYRDKFI
ncbi:MAG: hypothetical protein AAB496_00580 [Patescibacteria group bacterium]